MPFRIDLPTRHTDTFAATGFVHAGVLLALTEAAYAALEAECGFSKPHHVYAVQRATEARYYAPLGWQDGATLTVRTLEANERGFSQEFEISATSDRRRIAVLVHHWVWLDIETGRPVPLPDDVRERLLSL